MVKVKICGITNLVDALFACEFGADALGFIFYKKSPRYISPLNVGKIIAKLPPFTTTVGVFVNELPDTINMIVNDTGLNVVQLHGDEPVEFVKVIDSPVIKAVRIKNEMDVKLLANYSVTAFLLDSLTKSYGGSGKTFDWKIAKKAKKFGKIILSGGLTPSNVVEAIRMVSPYGVDVSSGVESEPGKKDKKKVKDFIRVVRELQ